MKKPYLFFFCLLLFTACERCNASGNEINDTEEDIIEEVIDPLRILAFEIASSLDENILASQVLISGVDGSVNLMPHIKELFTDCPPGGIMLFRYNLDLNNDTIRNFIAENSSFIEEISGIKPFVAVDFEGGTVNRFARNTQGLPAASSHPSAISYWEAAEQEGHAAALQKIENDSAESAAEIAALGINMNFAPVAESLTDFNSVFLSSRSYGHDINFTADAVCAFIRGMERNGILCVVKHFPASAGLDPHYYASVLDLEKAELDELVFPFKKAIEEGARAVMAAHTKIPSIDSEIASLSSIVMQNWLRSELGFNGIIISDDFIMEAAGSMNSEDAAVLSIAAGADMILVWPQNLLQTHRAIISALHDGKLSRERLVDAVSRIIYEKLCMGITTASSLQELHLSSCLLLPDDEI